MERFLLLRHLILQFSEHTIPRSFSCDNSQENLTLCELKYNRETKKNRIPSECPNHKDILPRISHWGKKINDLNGKIEKKRAASRGASTKEQKDKAIRQRHVLEMERNYLHEKYRRFTMEEVTSGFKNSQLVDTRILTKYARQYLKTVFSVVHTVNGKITSDFRNCLGVKKTRDNHAHHTIDATIVACITREQYNKLAQYYHEYESYDQDDRPAKPHFEKPWGTFTEDMKHLKNEILVSHYAPNHLLKQTKKRVCQKGKMILQQGQTARGSLHKETFYGRIKKEGEDRYVVRVPLAYSANGGLRGFKDAKDLERIVDKAVRNQVVNAITNRLKEQGKKFSEIFEEPIWMNKEKGIQIKKVRCFADSVKNPIALKKQTNLSSLEYKQSYYVTNAGNYLMAIYEEKDAQAKIKRDFTIANNLRATSFCRGSNDNPGSEIVLKEKSGLVLKQILKSGMLVLLWKESPDEV